MLDIQPTPQTPKYAFEMHDEVVVRGVSYRPQARRDWGHIGIVAKQHSGHVYSSPSCLVASSVCSGGDCRGARFWASNCGPDGAAAV